MVFFDVVYFVPLRISSGFSKVNQRFFVEGDDLVRRAKVKNWRFFRGE